MYAVVYFFGLAVVDGWINKNFTSKKKPYIGNFSALKITVYVLLGYLIFEISGYWYTQCA